MSGVQDSPFKGPGVGVYHVLESRLGAHLVEVVVVGG